jgi:hypothetical protein
MRPPDHQDATTLTSAAAAQQPLPLTDGWPITAAPNPTQPSTPAGHDDAAGRVWTADALAGLITRHRFTYRDEQQLHDGLAELFADHQIPVQREAPMRGIDRIDFLAGRIGIEVKTRGSPAAVLRQLQRYATSGRVDTLVLVTTVARHTTLPASIGGKPLLIASLLEGAL